MWLNAYVPTRPLEWEDLPFASAQGLPHMAVQYGLFCAWPGTESKVIRHTLQLSQLHVINASSS